MRRKLLLGCCAVLLGLSAAGAQAAPKPARQGAAAAEADKRADALLQRMTFDEQVALLHGVFPAFMKSPPPGAQVSAGYIPGVERLAIPPLVESDASLGVANAGRKNDDATPLPSGLAIAATFSPELAYEGGAMIGKEARQKGFNVLLAGGVNLVREPRNGRNFEYLGEDPLLAGTMDGASIRGIQSNHIVSTAKHYVLNDQETGRHVVDARIEEAALRESDLLAFEIALEKGHPGSVMCSYNKVNGTYACQNPHLLTDVLRHDWGWRGWVMSDWGAVPSLDAAAAGLDQQSGAQLDPQVFFDKPLKDAVNDGRLPAARVRQMAHRILRSMIANGLMEHPLQPGGLDTAADSEVSGRAAEAGIVLLKNEGGLLPLAASARRIAVIGGHADVGVLSGGGSSQVIPLGSVRLPPPKGAPGWGGGMVYHPSSPLKAIEARARGAQVTYVDGTDAAAAAQAAKDADVVVVFATQWASEGVDTSVTLPDDQDALIEAVAAANPHIVVVLETGGPVLTPWAGKVGALLEAWYPGARGGEAIAKILFGQVNPSGRLPVTFAASLDQLAHPELPGGKDAVPESLTGGPAQKPFAIDYSEGSDVGYRWFARTGATPAYPFGHGLSYTRFRYSDLKVTGGSTLTLSFTVANVGTRAGVDTPQAYLVQAPSRTQQRLIGWQRVSLKPGERRRVTVTADRRLLADWDTQANGWRLAGGQYRAAVGPDAATRSLTGSAAVAGAKMTP